MKLRRFNVHNFFVAAFFALILLVVSEASALSINDVLLTGQDGIPNYVRRSADTITVLVEVESSSEINPNQLEIGTLRFTSCEYNAISEVNLCSIEHNLGYQNAPSDVIVRLYDSHLDSANLLDSHTLTIMFDNVPPLHPEIHDVGYRLGGVDLYFTLSDFRSGIKKFEVRSGSSDGPIVDSKSAVRDSRGAYPEVFDVYADEPLFVSLSDGSHSLVIVAYDGFDNRATSSEIKIEVRNTPPKLGNWYLADCNINPNFRSVSEIQDAQTSRVGRDGNDLCVYLVLEEKPKTGWQFNVSLTNANKMSTQYIDKTYISSIEKEDCTRLQDEDGWYYCKFEQYRSNERDGLADEKIRVGNLVEGTHSFSLEFSASDHFGNIATKSGTSSVIVVRDVPEITSFGSEEYDGIYYGSRNSINVRLEFDSTGVLVDKDGTEIRGSEGISFGPTPATVCTETYCEWDIQGEFDLGAEGRIELASFQDVLGNTLGNVGLSQQRFTIYINNMIPLLLTSSFSRPGTAVEGYWISECHSTDGLHHVDNSNCHNCLIDDSVCDEDEFWDHKVTYFEAGDYLDVEVRFNNSVSGSAYLNVSDVVDEGVDGIAHATSCSKDGDDFVCRWDSVGPLVSGLDKSVFLHLIDIGGQEVVYEMPVTIYGDFQEGDLWVDVFVEDQSPPIIDRQIMAFGKLPQIVNLKFVPISGGSDTELIYVHSSCVARNSDGEIVSGVLSRNDIDGDWFGQNYFLNLVFNRQEYIGGNLDVNCTLTTRGLRNGIVYSDDRSVVFEVEFYNAPYGYPSREIQDEIDRIVEKYGTDGSIWRFIGPFNNLLRVTEKICDTFYSITTLTTLITGVRDSLVITPDPTGVSITAAGGLEGSRGGLVGTLRATESFLKEWCDWIMCRECSVPWGSSGGDGWQCAFQDWISLDVWSPYVTNLPGAALENTPAGDFFGRLDPSLVSNSLNTRDSMVWSILTLCPKDFLLGFEKQRQIECAYVRCLTENAVYGNLSVNDCKLLRSQAMCDRVAGELWAVSPLSNFMDFVDNVVKMLNDPVSMVSLGFELGCEFAWCRNIASGMCTACMVNNLLAEVLSRIPAWIEFVTEGAPDFMEEFGSMNACRGLEGFEGFDADAD